MKKLPPPPPRKIPIEVSIKKWSKDRRRFFISFVRWLMVKRGVAQELGIEAAEEGVYALMNKGFVKFFFRKEGKNTVFCQIKTWNGYRYVSEGCLSDLNVEEFRDWFAQEGEDFSEEVHPDD